MQLEQTVELGIPRSWPSDRRTFWRFKTNSNLGNSSDKAVAKWHSEMKCCVCIDLSFSNSLFGRNVGLDPSGTVFPDHYVGQVRYVVVERYE